MTTANNPENQNPKGLPDLGQIGKERACNDTREGMRDFIGPSRRVYFWNNGETRHFDPRCTTGGDAWRYSELRNDFRFTIDALDAPQRIAAGGTHVHIDRSGDDPERNVFPTCCYLRGE